jgi:hypothetical protein
MVTKGKRYRAHAPFGSWKTQIFIAGLCCHGLTAPWIGNAAMNHRISKHGLNPIRPDIVARSHRNPE